MQLLAFIFEQHLYLCILALFRFRFSLFIEDTKFAMPPIKFHDAAGVPIQFLQVDGVLYPYPEGAQDDSIRVKRDIPGRDDDVLLVSYSKAGQYTCTKIFIAQTLR